MTHNIMIAGVGGQGTVLASKLIAAAAMKKGCDVRTTETIGMAQRGGSVVSHVRIGDNIFSPLIPLGKADALIAFEPAEAVRQLAYLRGDGTLVVCDSAIKPISAFAIANTPAPAGEYQSSVIIDYLKDNVSKLIVIDGARLSELGAAIGSGAAISSGAKTLNVALLGAAAQAGVFPFDAETLKEIIPEMLHERFWEINIKSFETGRSLYNEYFG